MRHHESIGICQHGAVRVLVLSLWFGIVDGIVAGAVRVYIVTWCGTVVATGLVFREHRFWRTVGHECWILSLWCGMDRCILFLVWYACCYSCGAGIVTAHWCVAVLVVLLVVWYARQALLLPPSRGPNVGIATMVRWEHCFLY